MPRFCALLARLPSSWVRGLGSGEPCEPGEPSEPSAARGAPEEGCQLRAGGQEADGGEAEAVQTVLSDSQR